MNNYNIIKQMTVEQMTDFIFKMTDKGVNACTYCICNHTFREIACNMQTCEEGIRQWLMMDNKNVL